MVRAVVKERPLLGQDSLKGYVQGPANPKAQKADAPFGHAAGAASGCRWPLGQWLPTTASSVATTVHVQ